jgi:hypothetical protein
MKKMIFENFESGDSNTTTPITFRPTEDYDFKFVVGTLGEEVEDVDEKGFLNSSEPKGITHKHQGL